MILALYLATLAGDGYLALTGSRLRYYVAFCAVRSLVLMPWFVHGDRNAYNVAWWLCAPVGMMVLGVAIKQTRVAAAFASWQASALFCAWWNYSHGAGSVDVTLPFKFALMALSAYCLYPVEPIRIGLMAATLPLAIQVWYWNDWNQNSPMSLVAWLVALAVWIYADHSRPIPQSVYRQRTEERLRDISITRYSAAKV